DLDPVPGATFENVLETALAVRAALESLKMPCYAKTTGSKGVHIYVPIVRGPTQKQVWTIAKEIALVIYVPIVRGPTQKQVWTIAKEIALVLASENPELITAVYKVAKRPKGRVLVDYNQNAWGRTLASVYSVRPTPKATVSIPVTWDEIERGVRIDDFRLDNVRKRINK